MLGLELLNNSYTRVSSRFSAKRSNLVFVVDLSFISFPPLEDHTIPALQSCSSTVLAVSVINDSGKWTSILTSILTIISVIVMHMNYAKNVQMFLKPLSRLY